MSSPATGPLAGQADDRRIASLDVVRGVAVLGIVIANIIAFGQPMTAYTWPGAFLASPGPLADWLWGAQMVLVDGKFRGLFTLLFGAGMVLFLRRARARGSGRALLARRLGWLLLFGLAHWALLWRGDILVAYAAAGFVALWFVEWEAYRQLVLGLLGYAFGAGVDFLTSVPVAASAQGHFAAGSHLERVQHKLLASEAADLADGNREAALIAGGDYPGLVAHTIHQHLADLPAQTLLGLFETVPLILIGMGLLQIGLFDGGLTPRRQRRWGWALWLTGTVATVPIAWHAMAHGIGYWDSFAAFNGWSALPHLFAALGLAALLADWGRTAVGPLARRLAAAGRCAFSNYLGTSLVAMLVFPGWGLGLYGTLGRAQLYGVAALFWIAMLCWPSWWLARFRFGPLEWLWRCLTYGRMFALRRA